MVPDDTCCLDSDADLKNLILRTNAKINKIALWFTANKMGNNISKIKNIIYWTRNKK